MYCAGGAGSGMIPTGREVARVRYRVRGWGDHVRYRLRDGSGTASCERSRHRDVTAWEYGTGTVLQAGSDPTYGAYGVHRFMYVTMGTRCGVTCYEPNHIIHDVSYDQYDCKYDNTGDTYGRADCQYAHVNTRPYHDRHNMMSNRYVRTWCTMYMYV